MKIEKIPGFYKDELESISAYEGILNNSESINDAHEQGNDIILLEETDNRERLLSLLLADIKWTINSEGKVSYISPYEEDCIGKDPRYIIKKVVSRYLTQASVMACLIELEELIEMLRTSKHTQSRKLIVDTLLNKSDIKKIEISSSAIFDTQGNVVGIQGLCRYLK